MGHGSSKYSKLDENTEAPQLELDGPDLYEAVGNIDLMQERLNAGADVNKVYKDKGTALIQAIRFENYASIEFLLKAGANPNLISGTSCCNALSSALRTSAKNSYKITKLLLEYKANPNGPCYLNHTPLHKAVVLTLPTVVELLLINGANPNERDYDGMTPLIHAVYKENMSMIQLLLKYGANIDLRVSPNKRKTAFTYALATGNRAIILLLLNAEKPPDDPAVVVEYLPSGNIFGPPISSKDIVASGTILSYD